MCIEVQGAILFKTVVKGGLLEEMTFEQRCEKGEAVSSAYIWEKATLAEEISEQKHAWLLLC